MNDETGPTSERPTGEPVSSDELDAILPDRESLNDAVLSIVRVAADGGERTDLDQAMKLFGISRDELESEIDAGLHEI
jgi:hypothetical protein